MPFTLLSLKKKFSNTGSCCLQTIAISPQHLAHDFAIATKTHFIDDPDNAPLEFAERFADPNSEFPTADTALTSE